MFKNNKKEVAKKSSSNGRKMAATPSNALNSLVQGTTITGEIASENDIRIDGVVKGTINCNAKLIIGPSGYVEGEVNCKNAIIEGRLEGTLHVEELLNVRETAEVNGNIYTSKLIVQSGAVFNVGCHMGNQHSSKVSAPKIATEISDEERREKTAKKAS